MFTMINIICKYEKLMIGDCLITTVLLPLQLLHLLEPKALRKSDEGRFIK